MEARTLIDVKSTPVAPDRRVRTCLIEMVDRSEALRIPSTTGIYCAARGAC